MNIDMSNDIGIINGITVGIDFDFVIFRLVKMFQNIGNTLIELKLDVLSDTDIMV